MVYVPIIQLFWHGPRLAPYLVISVKWRTSVGVCGNIDKTPCKGIRKWAVTSLGDYLWAFMVVGCYAKRGMFNFLCSVPLNVSEIVNGWVPQALTLDLANIAICDLLQPPCRYRHLYITYVVNMSVSPKHIHMSTGYDLEAKLRWSRLPFSFHSRGLTFKKRGLSITLKPLFLKDKTNKFYESWHIFNKCFKMNQKPCLESVEPTYIPTKFS